jgi:hypothetical protein
MTPKEKQLALMKKRRRDSALTQPERPKVHEKGKNELLSDVFQGYLDYLLNLSAGGKKTNTDWNEMKKKLTEAGHWKKAYNK